jgi:hypothetical protein
MKRERKASPRANGRREEGIVDARCGRREERIVDAHCGRRKDRRRPLWKVPDALQQPRHSSLKGNTGRRLLRLHYYPVSVFPYRLRTKQLVLWIVAREWIRENGQRMGYSTQRTGTPASVVIYTVLTSRIELYRPRHSIPSAHR